MATRRSHPQPEEVLGQRESHWGARSCYDEGKRAAETLMMDYHRQNSVDVCICRIFNTYGPNMSQHDRLVVSKFHRPGSFRVPLDGLRRRESRDPVLLFFSGSSRSDPAHGNAFITWAGQHGQPGWSSRFWSLAELVCPVRRPVRNQLLSVAEDYPFRRSLSRAIKLLGMEAWKSSCGRALRRPSIISTTCCGQGSSISPGPGESAPPPSPEFDWVRRSLRPEPLVSALADSIRYFLDSDILYAVMSEADCGEHCHGAGVVEQADKRARSAGYRWRCSNRSRRRNAPSPAWPRRDHLVTRA